MAASSVVQTDLEAMRVADRTYVSRRREPRLDAATVLCVTVLLLTLIPTRYIVPGMTDVGRPGLIVGMLLLVWWAVLRAVPHLVQPGPQPIRWAVGGFALTMFISYAVGMFRSLTTMEANAADRAVLFLGIFAGIALTAADGVRNWERLYKVVDVLIIAGAVMAFIGLIQSLLRVDLTQFIIIPGLEAKYDLIGFEERGAEVRVASTMTHYLELATALAIIFPFALHRALFATTKRQRRLASLATLIIASGTLVTVSRSGILAMVVAVLVLLPAWNWRLRYNILFIAGLLGAALIVIKPGLVATFLSLFGDAGSDNSVLYRTKDYPMAFEYVRQAPLFGRGTGTYVIPQYEVLDNQWLMYLITNGIVGIGLFAAMHITGVVIALRAARRAATAEVRHLCTAFAATQVVAMAVAATYDSMYFMSFASLVALTLGLCGVVWRLTHPDVTVRTAAPRWFASDGTSAFLRQYIRPERRAAG